MENPNVRLNKLAVIKQRKFTKLVSGPLIVGSGSRIFSFKKPYMLFTSVNANLGFPLLRELAPANTFELAATARNLTLILTILLVCCWAKIMALIVESIAIDVVNLEAGVRDAKDFSVHLQRALTALKARYGCISNSVPSDTIFTDFFVSIPSVLTQPFKIGVVYNSNFTLC